MIAAKDFERLVHRYLDNVATPEDISELNSLLKTRPELADLFVEVAGTDFLCEQLREEEIDRGASFVGVEKRMPEGHRKVKRLQWKRPHRRRTSRWGAWLTVAACLAIVVGAHLINLRRTGQFVEVLVAHIQKTMPNVRIIRGADGRAVAAIVGMELFPGDRIETEKGEKAVFGYHGDETVITVGGGKRKSSLVVGTVEKGKRLRLEKGMIDASVAPQSADRHMVIETPHAKVEIVGTRFALRVNRTRNSELGTGNAETGGRSDDSAFRAPRSAFASTWLQIEEGLVNFTRLADGEAIEVAAGQFAVAGETAESFALKTYEAGTEYVDGPVIFQNDFEQERGNRPIWIGDGKGGYLEGQAYEDLLAESVRVEEIERNGKRTRALMIGGLPANASYQFVFFELTKREFIETAPLAFEWDCAPWTTDPAGARLFWGSENEVATHLNKWLRLRLEQFLTREDESGQASIEIKGSVGGARFHDTRIPLGPSVHFAIDTISRVVRMDVDNLVVRRMIPVTDFESGGAGGTGK